MNTLSRLHALDNLRALMMWLGIVLHVLVQHVDGLSLMPWRDPQTTPIADLLVFFIHAFRMPVFFILAGFFMALLVARRGHAATLKQRMRRLALPFVIFWPPVFLAMGGLAMAFVHRVAHGTWGLDPTLIKPMHGAPLVGTMHLWFLYLLIWFALFTYAAGRLAPRLPPGVRSAIAQGFGLLGQHAWGVLVLALPLVLAGVFYPQGFLRPSGAFLPPWQEWLHNGTFFVFGWYLFGHRARLFPRFVERRFAYAGGGLVGALAAGALASLPVTHAGHYPALIAFCYGVATWAWSFALIGLFLRHMPHHNRLLRYLAESSYWVYIVHMMGTIGIGAMLVTVPLPALAKVVINIAATSALGLLSYQLFVRHTWVGRLLNGAQPKPPGGAIGVGAAHR